MSKFIKVVKWADPISSYSEPGEIYYINVDEIYKIYEYSNGYKNFNFDNFNNPSLTIKCPTVIITKKK